MTEFHLLGNSWMPVTRLPNLICRTSLFTAYSSSFKLSYCSNIHLIVLFIYSLTTSYPTKIQRSSTFWYSSDFDGILRVLGCFLYAIHCFGALIRVKKTESMSHRLQPFVVTFHRHLHHILSEVYRQCLHVGVFHFPKACGASIRPRSFSLADIPLKLDELTRDLYTTHEQFLLSSFSSFATFSTFSPVVADKGLPHRCLLLTVFHPLLNCLTQ